MEWAGQAEAMHDLVLKFGESVKIGEIEVMVVLVEPGRVRLGITAPREIPIYRKEAFFNMLRQNWPQEPKPEVSADPAKEPP